MFKQLTLDSLPEEHMLEIDKAILFYYVKDKNIIEICSGFNRRIVAMSYIANSIFILEISKASDILREDATEYLNNWEFSQELPINNIKRLKNNSYDLLFINNKNSCKNFLEDFENCYRIIKPFGYILFYATDLVIKDVQEKYGLVKIDTEFICKTNKTIIKVLKKN